MWKNLLQEYAQEMNHSIPSYSWTRQASGKAPYTCTVEIGGMQYIGQAGRSKKESEIKASWAALLAIKGIFFPILGARSYPIIVLDVEIVLISSFRMWGLHAMQVN
jgi:hypothetical protein